MENHKIEFNSDKIKLKEMADGGYQIKIDIGEYEMKAMQEVIGLPKTGCKITIEPVIE